MRLIHDIALLDHAAKIAGEAIWPEANNVSVPIETLAALSEQVERSRCSTAEYMLIRDEAVWLMQAARNIAIYREDQNAPMIERWTRLAELLRAGIETDLVNAKKSIGLVS